MGARDCVKTTGGLNLVVHLLRVNTNRYDQQLVFRYLEGYANGQRTIVECERSHSQLARSIGQWVPGGLLIERPRETGDCIVNPAKIADRFEIGLSISLDHDRAKVTHDSPPTLYPGGVDQ
jgi:hypothetical protein